MGDDLIFAQKFTRTAAEGLELLASMDDPRAPEAATVVTAMMTTIQRGAKRLRARHVYTSAQDVLSALHHESDDILNARVHALGKLVTSYATGLSELVDDTGPIALPQTASDKWDSARATLDALLPKADAQDADMLSRLMRAPVTLEGVQPKTTAFDADIVAFPQQTEMASEDIAADRVSEVFDIPAAIHVSAGPQIALDTVMRDVVADALSVARSVGRTISLSYDMADAQIDESLSGDLRKRLGTALSQIIRQALPEGRVGHIDVNLAGEQMHIMAGTTAMRVALDPATAPAPKPLITAETENGLREQLAALMDPSDNFGTAS